MGDRILQNYVVCLIDIMGQKDRLRQWATLPSDGQITDSMIEGIKKTVGTVNGVRKMFRDYHSKFGPDEEKELMLPPELREDFRFMMTSNLKVQQFSDTLIFFSPIAIDGQIRLLEVSQIIQACCITQLLSLAGKVPIRGGIAIGPGILLEEGDLYGPCLSAAYTLENKCADWPRVLVSGTVLEFLTDIIQSTGKSNWDRINKMHAHESLKLIGSAGGNGHAMIDFMSTSTREALQEIEALNPPAWIAAKAYHFAKKERDNFQSLGADKLSGRYHKLVEYMESRLVAWGAPDDLEKEKSSS